MRGWNDVELTFWAAGLRLIFENSTVDSGIEKLAADFSWGLFDDPFRIGQIGAGISPLAYPAIIKAAKARRCRSVNKTGELVLKAKRYTECYPSSMEDAS